MKKLISTILILCMAISLIPSCLVFATEQAEEPSLTDAVGITTPATIDPDKNAYNLEPGTTYYVKPRKRITSNTSYIGPVNLANASVKADVKTYSFSNKLLSTSENELISTINFTPDTYKLIKPIENKKQLYTKNTVVYHYETYKKLRLPKNDKVALKFTADATVNFPCFIGIYRIFDKNNNLVHEDFTTSSITVKKDEALYIDKSALRPAEIPIYTSGEITFEGPAYYQNFTSNKPFEITGETDIAVGSKAKYSAVFSDTQQSVNRIIAWSVSDPDIATVSPSTGELVAKSLGETYLIAQYLDSGYSTAKKISVRGIDLQDISFDFRNYSIDSKFNFTFMHAIYGFDPISWHNSELSNTGYGGVCDGISSTALLIQQGHLDVNDYGSNRIFQISKPSPGSRLEFRLVFQQAVTNKFHAVNSPGTVHYDKGNNANKFEKIVALTKHFHETGKQPIVMGMINLTDPGAHAVIPYYVDDTDPTHTKVHIYDCNYPYSGYANNNTYRYLKLEKSNGVYTGEWEIRAVVDAGGPNESDEERYPRPNSDSEHVFNTKSGHKVFLSYYEFSSLLNTMQETNLYKTNDSHQMKFFSTEDNAADNSLVNVIRTSKDFTIVATSGEKVSISDHTMNSSIDNAEYYTDWYDISSDVHTLTLPYDTYTVHGESEDDIELNLSNDYVLSTIKSKDNSAVSFSYSDIKSNPSVEISPIEESDTFSVEHMYFDTDLKYDNLLFEGTQKGKLSIIPEKTGFAVTGATNLTFTATVSETPTTITLDEIAEGETIHIVLDGRDITVTDSTATELGTARMDSRSSTAKPVALLPEGDYSVAQTLEFETDDDTVIYYTTDGSTPDEESSIYFGPITVDHSMRIKAKAKQHGYKLSSTVTLDYTLPEVSAPVADISGGYYLNTQQVRLTTETEGAEIYYTTDGSDPRYNGTLYTFPVDIDKSCTLRACAKLNTCASETVDFEYTLDIDGAYLTYSQVVDGVVTATVEQAAGKEVTLIAVQYDASGKTEAIKIHKETIPESENLISFNSGLTGENIAVYVWDGVTPIPVK